LNGQTDATGAGSTDDTPSPIALIGAAAGQGALDQVSPQLPDLANSIGADAVQGALDRLTTALEPSLPYIIVGVALILLMGIRR
jgi:hypothetical protein